MKSIGQWIGRILLDMVRGFLIVAAIGLVGGIGLVYATTRALPNPGEWFLILALTGVAGLLGAAIALIWALSHLGHVRHIYKQVRHPDQGQGGGPGGM